MRVTVQETVGMGSTHQLNFEPSTTVGQLKQLFYNDSNWNKERATDMRFTFEGDILDQDEQTLISYGVEDRSRLQWINLTELARNFDRIGLKFIDVNDTAGLKRQPWSTKAPAWRRARHGLCFEGNCPTSSCKAYGKQVIMPIGYRKFDLAGDIGATTTICPLCKKYIQPTNCGFNNCWWKFVGRKPGKTDQPPAKIESQWKQVDDAYHSFDENSTAMVSWLTLELEVVKKSPLAEPSGKLCFESQAWN